MITRELIFTINSVPDGPTWDLTVDTAPSGVTYLEFVEIGGDSRKILDDSSRGMKINTEVDKVIVLTSVGRYELDATNINEINGSESTDSDTIYNLIKAAIYA